MPSVFCNAPPVTDPRWKDASAPVLEYLSEPRTWPQLLTWARENRMNGNQLRQCLAWLECQRLAASTNRKPILWYTGSCPLIKSSED